MPPVVVPEDEVVSNPVPAVVDVDDEVVSVRSGPVLAPAVVESPACSVVHPEPLELDASSRLDVVPPPVVAEVIVLEVVVPEVVVLDVELPAAAVVVGPGAASALIDPVSLELPVVSPGLSVSGASQPSPNAVNPTTIGRLTSPLRTRSNLTDFGRSSGVFARRAGASLAAEHHLFERGDTGASRGAAPELTQLVIPRAQRSAIGTGDAHKVSPNGERSWAE